MAVLRVSGEGLDLDACLAWIPAGMLGLTWRVGERFFRTGECTTNGFNMVLADESSPSRAVETAAKVFTAFASRIRLPTEAGGSASMDFALYVTSGCPSSITFPSDLLRALVEHGVELAMSAYPCSCEEDECDEDETGLG